MELWSKDFMWNSLIFLFFFFIYFLFFFKKNEFWDLPVDISCYPASTFQKVAYCPSTSTNLYREAALESEKRVPHYNPSSKQCQSRVVESSSAKGKPLAKQSEQWPERFCYVTERS